MNIEELRRKLMERSRRIGPALAVAVLAGSLGVYLAGQSSAATFAVHTEAEEGVLTGVAGPGATVGASGDASVRFGTTVPGQNPTPVPGTWPGAADTGYRRAPDYPGNLQPCPGTIQSNTTYRFCDFGSGLAVGTAASPVSNVTFYGCRFASNAVDDANVAVYGDMITFDYSSFEPSADTAPPTAYSQGYQYGIDQRRAGAVTVDHSDFWGWGNGIQFAYSTQAKPFIVRNSWFHDARADGGIDHTDAILSNEGGPGYMVFDRNTIASVGNTQGLALQTEQRGYDRVTITDNYFSGFGYTVAIGENLPSTNITFTGNTFGTDFKPVHGPLYSDADWNAVTKGNLWRNNKWHVVPGSYYTPASDSGKYWLPDGTKSTTDHQD